MPSHSPPLHLLHTMDLDSSTTVKKEGGEYHLASTSIGIKPRLLFNNNAEDHSVVLGKGSFLADATIADVKRHYIPDLAAHWRTDQATLSIRVLCSSHGGRDPLHDNWRISQLEPASSKEREVWFQRDK